MSASVNELLHFKAEVCLISFLFKPFCKNLTRCFNSCFFPGFVLWVCESLWSKNQTNDDIILFLAYAGDNLDPAGPPYALV